jgi:phosphohistidine phosphatase
MGRQLILLRHAKSSWDSGAKRDFDRPLNKRGLRNAPRMGRWLKEKRPVPDRIISSPARRAESTVNAVIRELGLAKDVVVYEDDLYLGDCHALLQALERFPDTSQCGLMVGHNPGLEDLLLYLCGDAAPRSRDGKILVTAGIARIAMPVDWRNLKQGCCDLLELVRPKELESE